MHEISIAQGIINAVKSRLTESEVGRVKVVKVRLGDLAGVDKTSLTYGFEITRAATPMKTARLEIEKVPVVCRCRECEVGFDTGRYLTICPNCGKTSIELVAGNEVDIFEIELDGDPE